MDNGNELIIAFQDNPIDLSDDRKGLYGIITREPPSCHHLKRKKPKVFKYLKPWVFIYSFFTTPVANLLTV